jgi:hypothetical protein
MARLALIVVIAALGLGCGKKPANDAAPPLVWHSLAEGEALSRRENRPAVVFFFAEWSKADKELDEVTFKDPDVRAALKDFVMIRVDCTDDEDRETELAKERFKVVGVPTVIARDTFRYGGLEVFRFNEYVAPEKFAATVWEGAKYIKTMHVDLERHRKRATSLIPPISWQDDWDPSEKKPVLLFAHDPTDERCTKVMRDTFEDPIVRSLVNESFIAVNAPAFPQSPALKRLEMLHGYHSPTSCEVIVAGRSPTWSYLSDGPMLPTPLAEWLEFMKKAPY